ncbi:hypothetical protein [Pontibacillus litoralis]|uniref:Uncharacterized protein n=1 Tax=Pontibacillus litoralis JSM 072002 TaxID=1385512 RepID=A0A0A5FZ39_9BACI|nr:hypothetical protein [Pontibacillus litoralis]KGX86101.1 hypothetical protein N784_05935 [Pontibacillus litoralis JSM 072002]
MRVYSRHDLLGEWLRIPRDKSHHFITFAKRIIRSFQATIDVEMTVPSMVYIRAESVCDFIRKEYHLTFDIHDLVWILYKDFMEVALYEPDLRKVYETITNDYSHQWLEVYHYGELVDKYEHKQAHPRRTIVLTVDKKEIRNGEALLAEMDQRFPNRLMVEDMLEEIVTSFLESNHDESVQQIVHRLVRKAEKYW